VTRGIPDIDELIGTETDPLERLRLARVHAALVRAGALPELPVSLEHPPPVSARAVPQPRRLRAVPVRRRFALRSGFAFAAAAAATVALAAGGAAYLATAPRGGTGHVIAMRATSSAPQAHATLRIGIADHAGNFPVTLTVRDLPRLPSHSYYEMFLTYRGRLVGSCGTFRVGSGTTVVHLNVPYRLSGHSGWVIRREPARRRLGPPLLIT
jgi:hypothetical protein